MRALLRRVSNAKVEVENSIVGQIKDGLLIYVGFQSDDCLEDFSWLAKKIIGLRIFEDSNGKMNLPISKRQGILIVSQFTLLGSLKKGYRPSFNRSSPSDVAKFQYERFLMQVEQNFDGRVESGQFGSEMKITAVDFGPVTLWIDSKNKNY